MRRTLETAALVLLFAVWAGSEARADVCDSSVNLIKNCGFETGSLAPWTGSPASQLNNWYGVDTYDAFTGSYGAYIAGPFSPSVGDFAFLSQSVPTTIGTEYYLTYALAHKTSSNPTATPDNVFFARINGTTVPASVQNNVGNTGFSYPIVGFFATTSTTTITFGAEDANFYFSVDDVTVAVVPEPSDLAMGLLGLIALAILGSRRHKGYEV